MTKCKSVFTEIMEFIFTEDKTAYLVTGQIDVFFYFNMFENTLKIFILHYFQNYLLK